MLQNDISTTAAFIAFWGSLVQIVVDIIGGLCCSVVLFSFSSYVLQLINSGGYFLHVDVLATRVKWLMDQPGGMKLNVKLDKTLGNIEHIGKPRKQMETSDNIRKPWKTYANI